MTRRIFRSIVLAALAVFVVTSGLHLASLYDYFSDVQHEQVRHEMELTVRGVEQAGRGYLAGLDLAGRRLTLIGADGSVIYDSRSEGRELANHLEREEIREAMKSGYGESSRYSETLWERSFYVAKRLSDGTVLRLSATHSSLLQLILGLQLPTFISIVLAVALSFWLAGRLAKRIVQPLNDLDLEMPLVNFSYPELQPLLLRMDGQQRELKERQLKLLLEVEAQERDAAMRREFTGNVSHELKTPLQSISGYSELLKAGLVQSADVPRFAASIYHEAQRLIALVSDLISLSQLDEGAQGLPWEQVELTELLHDVEEQLQPAAQSAGVEVRLSAAEPVTLHSIRPLVRTIIANLWDNAIKYNHRGGRVTVTLANAPGEAVLTVQDTGIGIPLQHQSRIFERFYRVDKGRSRAAGGTGLGLSIVKHAASVLGARVELESREGVGTKITVHFPLTVS